MNTWQVGVAVLTTYAVVTLTLFGLRWLVVELRDDEPGENVSLDDLLTAADEHERASTLRVGRRARVAGRGAQRPRRVV